MNTWIILPYDGSPLAKVTLRKVATYQRNRPSPCSTGVLLVTAGVDPGQLDRLAQEAQAIAGAIPLETRLLNAGEPIADLRRLAATLPSATFAAPLSPRGTAGRAPWYMEACRYGGNGHPLVLFRVSEQDIREFEKVVDGRHRLGGAVHRLLRGRAEVHSRPHTPVA